jgi:hypothetical protein
MNLDLGNPRKSGRSAIEGTVAAELWKKNVAFTDELKTLIDRHKFSRHPIAGLLETEELNGDVTKAIHLEFGHAFAQVFTDSLIQAMARTVELEPRLGPMGKVSARFLIQLNLLDELGYSPTEKPNQNYTGNPKLAHYIQFNETLQQLKITPQEISTFRPSIAAQASRKTFTDYFDDYVLLTAVLACAETIFTLFAGPWAKSVAMSTDIDTSTGYHAIHVEDESGEFLDDDHAEDSWYIFRQSVTPERYEEVSRKMVMWLDTWNDFCDNVMHVARNIKRK